MATGYRVSVADGEGRPLQFVPVVPVNVSTGAEGTAVNTDSQGYASFTGLADATYRFRVRAVKQQTVTIEIVMFTHDHGDADDGGGIAGAAITFAAPSFTLGTTNVQGAATTPVPSNSTIAAFDATAPTTSAVGDSAATGSAGVAARRDHAHGRESFATNALVLGTAAAAGAATTPMRSNDTIAAFDATVPTTSAVGDAAATGSIAFAARRDHTHGRESFATPAIVLGTAAAAGVATTPIRSDSTIVAFDVTAPTTSAVGDAAATGAAAVAARRDHTHGREAFATNSFVLGTAAAAGVATTLVRSDATIAAFDATVPTTSALADAAATGSAAVAARRDHKHGRESFGSPGASAVGDTASDGVATTPARSDHRHSREAFATNTIALGTAAAAGVATTLVRSDATIAAFDATVPTTIAAGDAAGVGAAAVAARRDHRHGSPSTYPATMAAPALTLGTANSAGAATTAFATNSTIAAFDTTVPTTIAESAAAATGSAAVAARRDHTHGAPATYTPSSHTVASHSGYTAWGAYTVTWSGAISAIGNATVTSRYVQIDKTVHFRIRATFGTTTSFAAGDMTFTLPVTAAASMVGTLGTALMQDTGTTTNTGIVQIVSTTTAKIRVTVSGAALVTNTVPHTWANTDVLDVSGTYETA